MKAGLRTRPPTGKIDYRELRKINPEAARRAVLEYLKTNGHNISQSASVFRINRSVIYDILRKESEGDLKDRSKAPRHQPQKTPQAIEAKVIEIKNKKEIIYPPPCHRIRKEKREFVDWYSAKPFEIVQMDLKYIRDHKASTQEQIVHLDRYDIPNYQWSALDVNFRFKLIAYSREKSWTNGLCWYLWVTSWLRSHGVKSTITFTVDNGEEFGGRLIQNHKGHCEENAHLPQLPDIDDKIRFVIPIMLDKVSVQLGSWSGYNALAQHQNTNA